MQSMDYRNTSHCVQLGSKIVNVCTAPMSKSKVIRTDIGVIGGGVAGLMVTKKLSELGYKVTLVEKQPVLAGGQSTKNEGWLHQGGYHSALIDDEERAFKIAERIMYGREQILSFVPEFVEDWAVPTFALIRDEKLAARAEERWQRLGVIHRKLSSGEFRVKAPEVDQSRVNHAYATADLSVNFRILYQKLLHFSELAGAKIVTGANFLPEEDKKATIELADGSRVSLVADMFICTTGLGTKELFDGKAPLSTKIRFWKSHSLIFPRLTRHSMYFIDPKEASVMHHGNFSIGCQSEDDFLVERPTFEIVEGLANEVYEAIVKLLPIAANHREAYHTTSCIKPDIMQEPGMQRSVDVEIHEPLPNYIVAFPGKVTESPFVADKLVHIVFNRSSDDRVALRQGDSLHF